MHLPNIPKEIAQQIRALMKRPEGTFTFRYRFDGLFDRALGYGVLLEVVTGGILFRLVRDADLGLHFIHSSPGTGTRDACANLEPLIGSEAVRITLVWSPQETRLHVGGLSGSKCMVTGVGQPTSRQSRVGADGAVYEIGDNGLKVMGVSVYSRGKPALQATAIEAWNEVTKAVEILLRGSSPDGYIFEVVRTNLIMTILVTGFETYCKRRFIELEQEGIQSDFDSLANEFLSRYERDHGEREAIIEAAMHEGITAARKLVEERRINFQNYDHCKSAFNKGYGIKFGDHLGVSNVVLGELQRLIGFRHRIVHISPLLGMLNQDRVPPEEPVFSNVQYAQTALATFDSFIKGLHSATLRLRPGGEKPP